MACRWVNSYSQLTTLIEELAIQLRVNINKRFGCKKQQQTKQKQPRTTQTEEACQYRYQGYNHSLKPSLGKELYPQKENPQHKKGCSHIQPAACALPYLSKRKEKELTWSEFKIRECSVVIFVLKPFLISLLENEKVVINFINPYVLERFSTINFANTFFFFVMCNVLRPYHLGLSLNRNFLTM